MAREEMKVTEDQVRAFAEDVVVAAELMKKMMEKHKLPGGLVVVLLDNKIYVSGYAIDRWEIQKDMDKEDISLKYIERIDDGMKEGKR